MLPSAVYTMYSKKTFGRTLHYLTMDCHCDGQAPRATVRSLGLGMETEVRVLDIMCGTPRTSGVNNSRAEHKMATLSGPEVIVSD